MNKMKGRVMSKKIKVLILALSITFLLWVSFYLITGNAFAILGAAALIFKKATWKKAGGWIMKNFLLEILQWVYGLTGMKILTIFLKRLVMEGLIGKFLKEHLFDHLIPSLKRLWTSTGKKMKVFGITIIAVLPVSVVAVMQIVAGGISGLGVILFIKLVVITVFKIIFAIILKIWGFADSLLNIPFLGSFLEIFAFSALISWIESKFPWVKKAYAPFIKWWNILSKQFWRFYTVLTGGTAKRVEGGSIWLAAKIDVLAGHKPHQIRLFNALSQKKEKQKQEQNENHPKNDGAQIKKFDAHLARKHNPSGNQRKKRGCAAWKNLKIVSL